MRAVLPRTGRSRLIALLIAASPTLVWAQTSPVGHLVGNIKSPDGKPVSHQLVRVATPRGNHEATTDAKGQFLVPNLVPGKVTVKVAVPGMVDIRTDIVITVNQTSTLNLQLRPQASAVVEVVAMAEALAVDPSQAKTGLMTNFDQINELPVVGNTSFDRVDQVIGLTPGANKFIIHGADEYQNSYQVDGVNVTDGNYGGRNAKMNNDFIDQVQVLTSGISARYGRFSGGVINVTTKSGTNEFQGTSRLEISNQKWNSRGKYPELYALFGMSPTPPEDAHHITQSYTFMGPILKDKLFFAFGYQGQSPVPTYHTKTTSLNFGGVPYSYTQDETRKDAKLDWNITTSHRLFTQFNETETNWLNLSAPDGNSTSLATLDGRRRTKKGLWSLGYTGQLSETLLLDAKYNDSYSKSGGSGDGSTGGATVPTWYDYLSRDILDNGTNAGSRVESHMKMAAASVTKFLDAAGQHQIEAGFQGYTYTHEAAAGKYPSGYFITFYGYRDGDRPATSALSNRNLVAGNVVETSLDWYQPVEGKVDTHVNSLYINDAWTFDTHWWFNLGLRYDRYKSTSTPEGNRFEFDAFTPRFSATYDFKGDKAHQLTLSAAEYAGAVLQGQLGAASVSQTPVQRQYVYVGTGGGAQGTGADALTANGQINWAAWGNGAGGTGQANPVFTKDPITNRNVFVDPNLKAPRVRELTLGYRHEAPGRAFTATFVRRWNDRFLDDFWYGNGMGPGVAKVIITNDPNGKSNYTGLEVTWNQQVTERLSYNANFTWSRTLGNASETLNGSTSEANNFGGGISSEALNPYGPIPSVDMPLSGNFSASYTQPVGKGRANAGLMATYRGRSAAGFKTGMDLTPGALVAQGYAATFTRTFAALGVDHQPASFTLDLQMGFEQPVYRKATVFAKVNINNLLNWMPVMNILHYGMGMGGVYTPQAPYDGMTSAYQTGRSVQLVTVFKF
ncbi:TonB-dependent receptor [Mesoterricola silvestris]|uniref:TonB-dependent receptor plug domain-containing protein n=1 Tax=Mesoterricola silvestris TaxID=2927979 RepID=A0AA48KA21_9BACT|nr:TonB-dependent receptor [Mesoterricola silvestris]BDU74151.1 hypothetical protein METEAL_33250 [Mesoterricola silvestris]